MSQVKTRKDLNSEHKNKQQIESRQMQTEQSNYRRGFGLRERVEARTAHEFDQHRADDLEIASCLTQQTHQRTTAKIDKTNPTESGKTRDKKTQANENENEPWELWARSRWCRRRAA